MRSTTSFKVCTNRLLSKLLGMSGFFRTHAIILSAPVVAKMLHGTWHVPIFKPLGTFTLREPSSLRNDYKATQRTAQEREAASLPRPSPTQRAAAYGSALPGEAIPLMDSATANDKSQQRAGGHAASLHTRKKESLSCAQSSSNCFVCWMSPGACGSGAAAAAPLPQPSARALACTHAPDKFVEALKQQQAQLVAQRDRELAAMEAGLAHNAALIEERDQGIREISHQIGEVNEMFQDLAVLINDQGVQVRQGMGWTQKSATEIGMQGGAAEIGMQGGVLMGALHAGVRTNFRDG
eukprot:scaffold286904_cov18-Tisochrysis_lutea.AAC.1